MTLEEYRRTLTDKQKRPYTRFQLVAQHIGGVFEGFAWTNAYLRAQGLKPLFCRPAKAAISVRALIAILQGEIENPSLPGLKVRKPGPRRSRNYSSDTPIEAILLAGLRRRWPCRATPAR